MAIYKIWDATNNEWITASVQGQKGERGYYFTPHLDSNGILSWTNNGELDNPQTVSIMGPQGYPGDSMNYNLLDNWDFIHPVQRGSNSESYIIDRWYKHGGDISLLNGIKITVSDDDTYIYQSLPYISTGNYIISIKYIDSDTSSQVNPFSEIGFIDYNGGFISSTNIQYNNNIAYCVIELGQELLSNSSNYPKVFFKITNGKTLTLKRAKLETKIGELPTLQYDIFQKKTLNSLQAAATDENGEYISQFTSLALTLTSSDWILNDNKKYYITVSTPTIIGNCHVIVSSAPENQQDWTDYSVICYSQDSINGSLTFQADAKPSADLVTNILVIRM